MSSPSERSQDAAIRLLERFDAFQLALTFAILGLSVQTAPSGAPLPAATIEVVAWVALLVSGVAGLGRARRVPDLYHLDSIRLDADERRKALVKMMAEGHREVTLLPQGTAVPIADQAESARNLEAAAGAKRTAREKVVSRLMHTQRIAFLSGLTLLVVSRSWPTVQRIADAIRGSG